MSRWSGDILLRAIEWGAVRRPDGGATRVSVRKSRAEEEGERGAERREDGGEGADVSACWGAAGHRFYGVRRVGLPLHAGPSLGRMSRRSTLELLLVVGTSAMLLPRVVSSPSPRDSSFAGPCQRGSAATCFHVENWHPLESSAAFQSPRLAVLAAPTFTCLGPAAAEATVSEVKVSSLRLRGGDEGGATAVAASPNGIKPASYKDAAANGLPLNGDGQGMSTDEARADGGGASGKAEEDRLVLQVDELKLEALRKLGQSLRIGGRGTARRKFKSVRKGPSKMDDAKCQNALRKAGLNPVTEIESVEVYKEDGTVWSFKSPRLLANAQANQFCVQGSYSEHKAPKPTEAQLAAQAFDQLSDIEKLRQLAAAEMEVSKGAEPSKGTRPEDVLAAEEVAGGGHETSNPEKGSAEDVLAANVRESNPDVGGDHEAEEAGVTVEESDEETAAAAEGDGV